MRNRGLRRRRRRIRHSPVLGCADFGVGRAALGPRAGARQVSAAGFRSGVARSIQLRAVAGGRMAPARRRGPPTPPRRRRRRCVHAVAGAGAMAGAVRKSVRCQVGSMTARQPAAARPPTRTRPCSAGCAQTRRGCLP